MSQIDEVLIFLSDGLWHSLVEVAQSLRTDYQRLERVVAFLADFNFVTLNPPNVRITLATKNLIESLIENPFGRVCFHETSSTSSM